jgi:hypothetical protein
MPGLVAARPWRLTMGLRPLDPRRWLEVDDRRPAQLAEKRRLLRTTPASVLAALPGSEVAGVAVLDAVLDHLDHHHPGLVGRCADGTLVEHTTGGTVDPDRLHPVDAAARLVQEDLCLMERRSDGWVLTAASVCFPSRWQLATKIGRDLAAIHAPIPGFAAQLGAATETTFDRLTPERPVWRSNWTIIDDPRLHQPQPPQRRPVTDPGRQLWWRVERETMRRVGDGPAALFTIGTAVTTLADAVAADPTIAPALLTTLPTVPDDTVAYKGWGSLLDPLRGWLEAAAP